MEAVLRGAEDQGHDVAANRAELRRVLEAPKALYYARSLFERLFCTSNTKKCTAPNNHLHPDIAFCHVAEGYTGGLLAGIFFELESSGIIECAVKDSMGGEFDFEKSLHCQLSNGKVTLTLKNIFDNLSGVAGLATSPSTAEYVLDAHHIQRTSFERGGPDNKFSFKTEILCVLADDETFIVDRMLSTFVEWTIDDLLYQGKCFLLAKFKKTLSQPVKNCHCVMSILFLFSCMIFQAPYAAWWSRRTSHSSEKEA